MAEARAGPRLNGIFSAGPALGRARPWLCTSFTNLLSTQPCICPLRPCAWLPVVKRAESSMTVFVAGRGHRPLLFAGLACLAIALAAVTHPKTALAADPAP